MSYPKIKISDDSGETVGITDNRLDVNVAGATITTGDIDVNLDSATDSVAVTGTVTVDSLDTQPATFNTVDGSEITTADNTNAAAFASVGTNVKEVQIQSLSTNVDSFYITDTSDNPCAELTPAGTLSLPISNLNLLKYKKLTNDGTSQKLLITALS